MRAHRRGAFAGIPTGAYQSLLELFFSSVLEHSIFDVAREVRYRCSFTSGPRCRRDE